MKGIIYCRVSTQEQAEDGNSLKTQERLCRDYARSNDIELIAEPFIEQGESAKTVNRTKLQEMMKYCKIREGEIDCLIIYRIDRLSRDTYDYAGLKAFFTSCKIKIVSISEPIEDNPVGRFIENTLAGIAQLDNEIRGERSKNGMIEALKEGRYVFKEPYGFDRIGGRGTATIKPNTKLAPKIKAVFKLILEGHRSLEEVRQKAKEIGVTREDGRPLAKSHFYKLVKNPAYKGFIDIPSMGIYQKGAFDYIVEPEVFDQVQQVLNGKTKKLPVYKKINPDFPLRGTIKCGQCNKRMTGNWAKKKYGHYRCTKCKNINIRKDEVEAKFAKYLSSINLKNDIANVIQLAVKLNWEQQREEIIKSIKDLDAKKISIKERQNKVIDKNISGVFNDCITKTKLSELEAELASINLEIMRYKRPEEDERELIEYSVQFLRNMTSNWEQTDVTIQNKLQKWLFPDGLVYKNGEFTTQVKPLTVLLNEELDADFSTMVTLRGLEPRFPP